jgi:hypothetical protein
MLEESFIWLLEHVNERVELKIEHSFGGQIYGQVS